MKVGLGEPLAPAGRRASRAFSPSRAHDARFSFCSSGHAFSTGSKFCTPHMDLLRGLARVVLQALQHGLFESEDQEPQTQLHREDKVYSVRDSKGLTGFTASTMRVGAGNQQGMHTRTLLLCLACARGTPSAVHRGLFRGTAHLDLGVGEVQGAQRAQAAEDVQRLRVDLGAEPQKEALQGGPAAGDPGQRVVAQAVAEGGVQRLQPGALQHQRAQHAAAPAHMDKEISMSRTHHHTYTTVGAYQAEPRTTKTLSFD